MEVHDGEVEPWRVTLVDTGADTQTGGRVKRVAGHLDGETFLLTYGDGLADIDISALLAFHRAHGRLATVTAVQPLGRFGALQLDDDAAARHLVHRKAGRRRRLGQRRLLRARAGVLDYIAGDDTYFEREPLERLARDGELMAYRHRGLLAAHGRAARQEPARTALAVGPGAVESVVSERRARRRAAALFDGVYAGRRVLVTGDTGFKGSWLCAWLAGLGATGRRLRPGAADRPEPLRAARPGRRGRRTSHGDVRDLAALAAAVAALRARRSSSTSPPSRSCAPSYADPRGTFATNVMGTVNLFEAVRALPCGARRGRTSPATSATRTARRTRAYREGDALGGHDPYSASKGCAELVSRRLPAQLLRRAGSPACVATARAGNVHRRRRLGGRPASCPTACGRSPRGAQVVVRRPDAVRPWQHVLESLSGYLWLGARLLLDGQRRRRRLELWPRRRRRACR